MTDMLLTLVSAVIISNLVLQMPLAFDSVLAPLARRRVHALGLATTLLILLSGELMALAFLGFNAMIKT